ncbi:hypothetical protein H257_19231 [Aphanomyces astaci]|uniref:Uncharacterized protein n=1 Tax=Aphanomyces astaci TaxID=112090 RepID=W4F8Q1_APHAT|nr:hypothetical protein H257_19231 [Aphanomyces astaci]ETV63837.1 hypothetical protein H257_19231 [Aphanomyces astaci]|eukprot:XP_009846680.1 hypothetical protein H257_19231 [Aphanomyces astaci]
MTRGLNSPAEWTCIPSGGGLILYPYGDTTDRIGGGVDETFERLRRNRWRLHGPKGGWLPPPLNLRSGRSTTTSTACTRNPC